MNDKSSSTELNEDLPDTTESGAPGGDTARIAGIWDGSIGLNSVYWHIAANGVLTQYDYQQDGMATASGDNCYLIGNPITLTPEGDDSYSIADVTATMVLDENTLTVTIVDTDKHDINLNGNLADAPTINWARLSTPTLQDLNRCDTSLPTPSDPRPAITLAQCKNAGGSVVGDIGDGAIHSPDYRCESGLSPIGSISYPNDGPIPVEGSVCCV